MTSDLMGKTFSYPDIIRPEGPPHVGTVVSVREASDGTILVLLSGKKVFVPLGRCQEIVWWRLPKLLLLGSPTFWPGQRRGG
jgi:hypothetical protein